MSPGHKRQAVKEVAREGLSSKRAACRYLKLPWSSYCYRAKEASDKMVGMVQAIIQLSSKHPRYGYRRIRALLVREGWQVSRKFVQKLLDMLRKRIDDEAFVRLVGKWLHVGVLEEDGEVVHTRNASPVSCRSRSDSGQRSMGKLNHAIGRSEVAEGSIVARKRVKARGAKGPYCKHATIRRKEAA